MFWFFLLSYIWQIFVAIGLLLVVFYPGVWIFWLIMHLGIERWRRVGKRAYWIASLGWPLTAIPLIYFRQHLIGPAFEFVYGGAPQLFAMIVVGTITFSIALAIAFKANKVISLRTVIGLPELEPGKNPQPLITTGIYARTRNPVYLVHWLLLLSSAAITGFASNWAVFLIDCAVLPLMIGAEERELLNRYGAEFADYMRRVPRFFPKWTW